MRVVLLGASNLSRGLPTVLGLARATLGPGPLEILVAAGHGRSYGRWSRVGLRGLPGILDCELWPVALASGRAPTYALLTDVGNDLAFGATPAALAAWVGDCLGRLTAGGAAVAMTLVPARSLGRLAPWQYHLFKAVLFPGRRLPFRTLRERVAEVNDRLAELAARAGVKLVEPDTAWYGLDAIHIARGRRTAAWHAILAAWGGPAAGPPAWRPVACRGLRPALRTVAGIPLRRPQPSAVLADGTSVSLF